jgi:Subtilase family/Ricin-type beta-trefoil lectin domain-like
MITPKRTRLPSWVSLGLSVALLGCNSINPPAPVVNVSANGYILTLKVSNTDSASALETRYAGKMLAYQPDAGFAMLFSPNQPSKTDPAITAVEGNGTVSAPVVNRSDERNRIGRQGVTSNSSGWTAWSNGAGAWSGGWTAWSGGWTAWSGSTGSFAPELPAANQSAWNQIKLYEAHRITRNYGAGVKVAVIDTGIDTSHPIFQGHLAPSSQWKDYVDGDTNPQEDSSGNGKAYGHGTAVAGVILQVAPRVTILPIRVLKKDGDGNTSDIVSAISYAVGQGAQIINLSLGTDGWDQSLYTICSWANTQGVRIVASAGNNGQKDNLTSPGMFTWYGGTYMKTIGVGSVNTNDALSSFSAFGGALFSTAPGESIFSAYPGNRAVSATGTSFAAPLYTGAIALAYADMPNTADRSQIEYSLWYNIDWTVASGGVQGVYGRLNLERLIRSLPGWTEPTAIQPGVYNVVNVNSNKCLDVNAGGLTNGTLIQQWTCYAGNNNQKWRIEPVGSAYKLTAVHSGKVLDVKNASMADGGTIHQWDYVSPVNQLWNITKLGSGYQLTNVHSGKNLDVLNFGTADGATIQQTGYNGSTAQQFRLQALF